MRWLVFAISALLLAAGVFLGFVYPATTGDVPGRDIGRFAVYAPDSGFATAEASLSMADGPTAVSASIRMAGQLVAGGDQDVLRLDVRDEGGQDMLAAVLRFPEQGTLESPQTAIVRYDSEPVVLDAANGLHGFTLAAGPDFPGNVQTVELVLKTAGRDTVAGPQLPDIAMMVIGACGMFLSLRRRRENPNSQPPPKWGRR